ncbi:MAG: VWA domain-containing protein [Bdellovibrionaceae bacterium]|jgi:uncharacterized protein YegL|nr:VWA domain-containing protein [Pseudobdellovibrionaceae bacterium]
MSLDEKLFNYVWKTHQKVFQKKTPEYSVDFDILQDRLGVLSSLLATNALKVKKGKYMGGLVGDTLYFPPQICVSEDSKINELAYLYNTCFAITAQKLGLTLKYSKVSEFRRIIVTLAAAPAVINNLQSEYPALAVSSRQLYEDFVKQAHHQNGYQNYVKPSSNYTQKFIHNWSVDICNYILHGKKSENSLIKSTQADNLTINEIIKLSALIEKHFKKSKTNQKLQIPPFFSLLPLDGIIQFYKENKDLEDGENSLSPETVLKTDPKDIVKRVELKDEENFNPVSVLMESTQTADIFSGGMKRIDGSDELNEHQDALKDLNVSEVVRTNKETKSIFQADIAYEVVTDEEYVQELIRSPSLHYYSEWNYNKKAYLEKWCCVYESMPENTCSLEESQNLYNEMKKKNHKHILDLKHKIEKVTLSRQWKNRQLQGEEIDIDAVVDGIASICGGKSPDEKFYLSKRKKNKDISMLILLDASLSADSWVEGQRVLDISRESIVIIQEALSEVFENTSIMAFNGQTRQKCEYHSIKEFNTPWKQSVNRLFSVEPAGYTRIGAALRHSIHKMEKTKSKKKIIILLSDGKPTDYDIYEGKYGVQDVRQVVREAKRKDISIFSLAVDQQAKFYFPQMFGKNNFRVIKNPSFLADSFIQLFMRMI